MSRAFEAETQVLGAIMLDNAAVVSVRGVLPSADCFSGPGHRDVFAAMLRLADRGSPIDVLTLLDDLDEPAQQRVGGVDGLTRLDQAAGTALNVEHHALLVREVAHARTFFRITREAGDRVRGGEPLADVLPRLLLEVEKLGPPGEGPIPLAQAVQAAVADAANAGDEGDAAGLRTGLDALDDVLGPLRPGHLVVFAGRPAMGKSALGMQIALAAASLGPVLVFSLEMTSTELATRLLCGEAMVDSRLFTAGSLDEDRIDRLIVATERLKPLPLYIDPTPGVTLDHINAAASRMAARHGGRLAAVVVDYLQLMGGRSRSREEEVARNSRGLKALAKRIGAPVLLLSQLNRNCEGRTDKRPMLSDLRESGAVEQDADAVVMLYRDEYYHPDSRDRGVAEAIVAKNRHGPTGTARLRFIGPWSRFVDRPPAAGGPNARERLDS